MAASQSPSTSQVGEDLSGADLNGLIINEQPDDLCVLDCRMGGDTLKSASRVRLPNVLARRLIAGSLQLSNVSPRLQDPSVVRVVIVPGDNATDAATSTALANLLRREGFRFRVLSESVDDVLGKYPALRASAGDETSTSATAATTTSQESRHSPPGGSCSSQSSTPASTNAAPNTGGPPVGYLNLGSLCLETGTNEARVQEKARAEFPVEILPYLYLGNGETARNREVLDKHGITYIINVTTNLANEFEDDTRMHYLRISVDDNSSHNLTKFFTEAIAFIEAARMSGSACLVHCLAGISRSVTICLAYLMTVNKYTLEDAYDMVQNRNASIAPNFHFMGQLTDYERHLGIRSSCVGTYPSSAPRSPCAVEAAAATALLTPPPTSCSASPQSSIHSAKSFH